MDIRTATNQEDWDTFLTKQKYRPFMQSWTMGEVYREIGEEPIRLEMHEDNNCIGICQALIINARRGKHLVVPYGPILTDKTQIDTLIGALKQEAIRYNCSFIRISPFWKTAGTKISQSIPSPLHLLAEHIWYIPLTQTNQWEAKTLDASEKAPTISEDDILKNMRGNTRNLIRRAQKEGVTIIRSTNPIQDIDTFIHLHEETRKRHSFTPYSHNFFRAQVAHFSRRNECTMYQAHYQGEVIASSIHMHTFGETSYHHGASTHKYSKIPASYLLQWTAIQDAMIRGDHIYNFWGIAPPNNRKNHPFAGVTTFKTGFGGTLLELTHCIDVPVHSRYYATRTFERIRKWRRGF